MIDVLKHAAKKNYYVPRVKDPNKRAGNPNILNVGVRFTAENNVSPEGRKRAGKTMKENVKRRRDLAELLEMSLKGGIGEAIEIKFKDAFGSKPRDLKEALDMVMIAKVITLKDTAAYMALMQTAGLNKPIKIDTTSGGKPIQGTAYNYGALGPAELITLRNLAQKAQGGQVFDISADDLKPFEDPGITCSCEVPDPDPGQTFCEECLQKLSY